MAPRVTTVNLANSPGFPVLARAMTGLAERGILAYLVGGFIRDTLLKRHTADIDLALPELELDTVRLLADELGGSFVTLDEFNKIARIVLPWKDGRTWNLDFSSLRGAIEDDLRERDFTLNAMAAPCQPSLAGAGVFPLIDPLGGVRDLEDRTVRVVSDRVFGADPARLLRAIRFAAELNFTIEEHTGRLIRQHAHLLKAVAGERIRVELIAIIKAPGTYSWLTYMDKVGLLAVLFPELNESRNVEQPKEHYWDVFNHSLQTVAAVERLLTPGPVRSRDEILSPVPWSADIESHFSGPSAGAAPRGALLKLAGLLHDIAKPRTRTREGDRWRFLGHAKEGAATVETILQRLRFSRREINIVVAEVQHHLRPGQMGPDGLPSRRAIYRFFRDTGEVALDTLFLSLADHLASRGPELDKHGWEENARTVAYILKEREKTASTVSPPKLVDGHDLMRLFGMKPGRELGGVLEEIREAQAAGEITIREEALAFVRRKQGLAQGE
ncbi:MAG: HD domain-containing protein [Chloroflexi bacterium]|nr:HD domain-containing protein [Chloroflexota bacterium]